MLFFPAIQKLECWVWILKILLTCRPCTNTSWSSGHRDPYLPHKCRSTHREPHSTRWIPSLRGSGSSRSRRRWCPASHNHSRSGHGLAGPAKRFYEQVQVIYLKHLALRTLVEAIFLNCIVHKFLKPLLDQLYKLHSYITNLDCLNPFSKHGQQAVQVSLGPPQSCLEVLQHTQGRGQE